MINEKSYYFNVVPTISGLGDPSNNSSLLTCDIELPFQKDVWVKSIEVRGWVSNIPLIAPGGSDYVGASRLPKYTVGWELRRIDTSRINNGGIAAATSIGFTVVGSTFVTGSVNEQNPKQEIGEFGRKITLQNFGWVIEETQLSPATLINLIVKITVNPNC